MQMFDANSSFHQPTDKADNDTKPIASCNNTLEILVFDQSDYDDSD
jgi:hypothetical protein